MRELLKLLKIKKGMEIHYDGDLPARSGKGSSSCFVVGLLKALNTFQNKKLTPKELAKKSIFLERFNKRCEIIMSMHTK